MVNMVNICYIVYIFSSVIVWHLYYMSTLSVNSPKILRFLYVHINKHFALYGVIDWKSMSVMSCVFHSSREPQIKGGMRWPVEGTRKHFLVCSLTRLKMC